MWQARVSCSACADEVEVLVEDLDELDREVCPCGYSYVVISLAEFEPVYAEPGGELIALPLPQRMSRAA